MHAALMPTTTAAAAVMEAGAACRIAAPADRCRPGLPAHTQLAAKATGLAYCCATVMLMRLSTLGRSRVQAVLQDTVLAPLVVNAALLPVQVQLLAKLAKDVDTLQPRLLELLLRAALSGSGSAVRQPPVQHSGRPLQAAYQAGVFAGPSSNCCWLEPHINLFKALIDSAPQLIAQQLPLVLQAMQAAVQQPVVAKSAAFGQVLMVILKNYGGSCTQQQVEQLQDVVSRTATFHNRAQQIIHRANCANSRGLSAQQHLDTDQDGDVEMDPIMHSSGTLMDGQGATPLQGSA